MKLFLLTRKDNPATYEMYSSAVVCAKNEEDAKTIRPDGKPCTESIDHYDSWVVLSQVRAEYLGVARPGHPRGVVCADNVGG